MHEKPAQESDNNQRCDRPFMFAYTNGAAVNLDRLLLLKRLPEDGAGFLLLFDNGLEHTLSEEDGATIVRRCLPD